MRRCPSMSRGASCSSSPAMRAATAGSTCQTEPPRRRRATHHRDGPRAGCCQDPAPCRVRRALPGQWLRLLGLRLPVLRRKRGGAARTPEHQASTRGLGGRDPVRPVVGGGRSEPGRPLGNVVRRWHAIATAAGDGDVVAAIAQCPFTDGLASARQISPAGTARLASAYAKDQLARAMGRPPVRVKVAAHPGETGLMDAPDVIDGVLKLLDASGLREEDYRNDVPARVAVEIPLDAPGRLAEKFDAHPLCVCDDDSVAPASTTLRHAAKAPRGEIRRYPAGHFDIYVGEEFERVIADQLPSSKNTFRVRRGRTSAGTPLVDEMPKALALGEPIAGDSLRPRCTPGSSHHTASWCSITPMPSARSMPSRVPEKTPNGCR